MPDVFVSYDRDDGAQVQRIINELERARLDVFVDTARIGQFASISDSVRTALSGSRVLLAYYSLTYAARWYCQEELTAAYLAGAGRVLLVNPESSIDHIGPERLRDTLIASHPATKEALDRLVGEVAARVAGIEGVIGDFTDRAPRWLTERPRPTPNPFIGRWAELWWSHSALLPIGPLTERAPAPVVVVHGLTGIGKTALAAEYVRRFGSAFSGGVAWQPAREQDGADRLWVLDEVRGEPDEVRRRLPRDAACLLLTSDPRLAELGTSLELGDLDTELPEELSDAASGDTGLRVRLDRATDIQDAPHILDGLHSTPPTLLAPTIDRLLPEVREAWDAVRVFTAVAPSPVSVVLLADSLAVARGSSRAAEFESAQEQVSALLSRGLLRGSPFGEEFELPPAFALALRQADPEPVRAERLRAATLRVLTLRTRSSRPAIASRSQRTKLDEEEQRGAHRVLNELKYRIAVRELPAGEGSLQKALGSLYTLTLRLREIRADLHPLALRRSTAVRPGLETIFGRLLDDLLPHLLTRWHPRLDEYLELRPSDVGSNSHELAWPYNAELREELAEFQTEAREIADELGVLSGTPLSR